MKTFFDAYFSHDHEIEESLDKLRDLSLFSTHGDEIQSLTLKLEELLDKERLQNLQQRPVTDYFEKLQCFYLKIYIKKH